MSLPLSNCVLFFRPKELRCRRSRFSACLDFGLQRTTSAKIDSHSASTTLQRFDFEETKARIAKLFDKNEVSISTYDTAWVAMAPSPTSSEEPCFPHCLNWLLENQCCNGSWARPHHHSMLKKDVISSTLACILALKKWGVGEEQINRGLHFIELNFASVTDKCQITPMGFDVVFPAMLDYSRSFSLDLRLDPTTFNDLMSKRDMELKRYCQSESAERDVYWAYIAEGMGKLQDWESVMKYQRSNGSLFNSPSTTAAAFIANRNSDCLNYLHLALNKFGSAVPAVYPLDIYSKLCTVDNVECLGISRYFLAEIQSVLDETYRCWMQGNEEIFMDASTCALAFRILRMNGYNVTSDPITEILQERFSSSIRGNTTDINTTLELYKASAIQYPDERDLEKQNIRLKLLLEQKLASDVTESHQLGRNINVEVKQALECPFYAVLDRIATRKNIEHYNFDCTRYLKTSYCSPNFGNKDFHFLSVQDFNRCQVIYREELRELERWVVENRLDELKFARSRSAYCYFSVAATIFVPEQSNARMSWAKNSVLATVIDDFFDVGGSVEELKNLIKLVELWDVDVSTQCCSHNVQIIFSALKGTICEIGDMGFKLQGRRITDHIIAIWLDLLHSMMKETEWARDKFVPTIDEYMSKAYLSSGLGPIVLPALYLVGPKLSEEMVSHSEYHYLFKSMSMCGRLLNDIQSYEREVEAGKLNALSLDMINNGGETTKEAAILELKRWIDTQRKELLRLVLEDNKSVLPKPCKTLFWHMCCVVHLFYSKDDGFTSKGLIDVVNSILNEPIAL